MSTATDGHPIMDHGFECFKTDIHSSSVKQYHRCPREFLYDQRFHLRPRGYYSAALELGKFFHTAMEVLLQGGTQSSLDVVLQEKFDALAMELTGDADDLGLLPNGKAADQLIYGAENDKTIASVMAQWCHKNAPLLGEWEVVSVEETIRITQAGPHPAVRGTLDLLAVEKKSGDLWIIDHKTTSYSPQMMAATYAFDVQPQIYRLLAKAKYPDKKIAGVIHNLVKKPTIRQKKSQDWDDYLEEITEWYSGTGRWAKYKEDREKDPPFVRSYVRFDQLETLSEEVRLQLEEVSVAMRANPNLDRYPRYSHSCFAYNKLCRFHPLCSTNPATWEQLLKTRYEVGHRDDGTEFVTLNAPYKMENKDDTST